MDLQMVDLYQIVFYNLSAPTRSRHVCYQNCLLGSLVVINERFLEIPGDKNAWCKTTCNQLVASAKTICSNVRMWHHTVVDDLLLLAKLKSFTYSFNHKHLKTRKNKREVRLATPDDLYFCEIFEILSYFSISCAFEAKMFVICWKSFH